MSKVEVIERFCSSCSRMLFSEEQDKCFLCLSGIKLPAPKRVISENTRKAKFVTEIEVIDPDTKNPIKFSIYREQGSGLFGLNSSYLERRDVGKIISPFGNGELELEGD